uniref:Uncharacterized protein n=1 Tax=Opuntia streptacantha TaxID=393608 RepID=A0A7C8YR39_OPUST
MHVWCNDLAFPVGIPAMPTSDDPVRPCQRAIIPPSANVCGRHCQCAAVIAETVPLRDEVARLKIELNNVNCRLEKLEREAVFKPSGGEQSQSERAISKKYVPPSQDKRRRSTKTPVRRGRSSAKETGGSSPVAAVPPRQAVGTFADLFSNSNKPREASSSSPAAHSPSFLGRIQANVDSQSQGIVFRQRSREAVNDAENLNEPPAQAGRAQHEGPDVDSL